MKFRLTFDSGPHQLELIPENETDRTIPYSSGILEPYRAEAEYYYRRGREVRWKEYMRWCRSRCVFIETAAGELDTSSYESIRRHCNSVMLVRVEDMACEREVPIGYRPASEEEIYVYNTYFELCTYMRREELGELIRTDLRKLKIDRLLEMTDNG